MRRNAIWVLMILALVPSFTAVDSWAQFAGATFEERKRAYIDDQGEKWSRWFPHSMRQPLWAWLERPDLPGNRARISEEIGYLTSEADCQDSFLGWENCWWTGDHPTTIVASRILLQYYYGKKVISDTDALKIKKQLRGVATSPGIWCGVANYQFRYLVTAYLYATRVEDLGQITYPPPDREYNCPPAFTYNGRRYEGGRSYDAKTLYADYLHRTIDETLEKGSEEDLSPSEYYAAQLHAFALLYDFSPDPALKNKAKLLLDWLMLNYAIGFSANHVAGGHGRHYRAYECGGQDSFPFSIFYNIAPEAIDHLTRKIGFTEFYVTSYRHPQMLVNLVEDINSPNGAEGDDYYRIIRGHVPSLGGKNWYSVLPQAMRYDYVTKNYNLGGTNFGTGWELNIKVETGPFKIFINEQTLPSNLCSWSAPGNEAFVLGINAYQHRNALFIDGNGSLYQWLGRYTWDEQSTESGWQFFRKGKVAVAITIRNSSALEVCTIGVDYPSHDDFKSAIKTRAELGATYYKTSKGVRIDRGYVDYGADFSKLPFDRLEVWEGHAGRNDEKKIVDWNSKVMTISRHGKKIVYDFNNWVYNEDGTYVPPDSPPAPPTGFRISQ
ncbi:MAG: hypothetical protein ONB46_12105 [candidate division KSB1 bacterium]|nr:hypothetical protein [candidate division KSB1 bacterium]MDZ7366480.1 hypothetical protein [candidate division KSB1 bacterium]MDZ7404558.1 hypothetical protein [candidate division KSB1 bacterium]